MTESIKQILIRRDGFLPEEAEDIINEAKETLNHYLSTKQFQAAEQICQEYFNLEPDYIDELID